MAFFAVWLAGVALQRREREFARREKLWDSERKDLLNRIMYLAEKPWEMPAMEPSYAEPTVETDIIDPLLESLP